MAALITFSVVKHDIEYLGVRFAHTLAGELADGFYRPLHAVF